MKKYIAILFLTLNIFTSAAQVPASCFEIESILVDACSNNQADEMYNEMVRFRIGNVALNTSNLNVTWPSGGAFFAVCQNAVTLNNVAQLNSTIVSCGLILEPVGNILPPGSTVILVTGQNMDVNANSFVNLTDTIYMIFQCAGSLTPHFRNYATGTGPRTLTMDFGVGCSDVVTYVPDQLVNQNGVHVAADGATVNFDWNGNPTYVNNGCQAPINQIIVDALTSKTTVCSGDSVVVSVSNSGINNPGFSWSGGSGNFSSANTQSTYYVPSVAEQGSIWLKVNVTGSCNSISDSVEIIVVNDFNLMLNINQPPPYCNGDKVELTANGGTTYSWSTGETASSITVSSSGSYIVLSANACFTQVDSVIIIYSSVEAAFSTNPATGFAPVGILFINNSVNASGYVWDFGDGNSSADSSPTNIYYHAGNYLISLTVTDSVGCTAHAYEHINIAGDTVAFFPNSFTPNNDGRNELFKAYGRNIVKQEGIIYNRWGQKVNVLTDDGWNGKNLDNNDVPFGLYIYDTEITVIWGEIIEKKGWVVLMR